MTDPYQVLGISPNATDDEVKKAYKELSRKYHPDSYANNPLADLAEDKFKEVQAAYTQIMNSRANGGSGYSQGYQNGYNNNTQGGYNNGGYNSGNTQGGYTNGNYNNGQYNRQSYQNYGQGYGRNPNGYYGSGGCSTGNICCDLWCADSLCECMGGDLCSCI
ncbi:MAG: DnaJ domain-containing protein [Lachnospiraceae bacterium]|nr:DnaJ domain-containing protein [Lachnospiraceae bacterium]